MTNKPISDKEDLIRYLLQEEELDYTHAQIAPRQAGASVPLSHAQERLWFLHHLDHGGALYNMPFAIRMRGALDLRLLEQSFNEIVRRHEILRTSFPAKDGAPYQNIASELTLKIGVERVARHEDVVRGIEEESRRPFDVAHGPLLRVRALQLAADDTVVLWTMHHLVSDGWSTAILADEMRQLYGAYVNGDTPALEELPIQYGDYAIWQRSWLQGEVLDDQLEYWRRQLQNMTGVLELPMDSPRPATAAFKGAMHRATLNSELSLGLRKLAHQENVTLFMLIMAAFHALLSKYTGKDDIFVGTPIANRIRPEVDRLIGLFMNTLVIRTRAQRTWRFRELLTQVKEAALAAFQHQDVPFEKLVEELKPERDGSRSPLFQIMFILQNAPAQDLSLPGLQFEIIEGEGVFSKFDLTLTVMESATGIALSMEYNSELFLPETMVRLAAHWQNLLHAIVAAPEITLAEIDVLSPAERVEILQSWNNTEAWYPQEKNLAALFEEQAGKTPAAVALSFEGRSLSYAELNRHASQLAHLLLRKGLRAERVAGICMERGPEMITAILGVLKAGGAYLPMDPAYPRERLCSMARDSGASVFLTQERFAGIVAKLDGALVCVDRDWPQIASEAEDNPGVEIDPGSLAYVIYTSGSTGRPKGVMISHRNILNRLWWTIRHFLLGADDAILQKTTFSFDASVWEIFVPLFTGARLVLARHQKEQNSRYLIEAIQEHRITVLQVVPSMLSVLLQEPGVEKCAPFLKQTFSGGEALSAELVERFRKKLGGVRLHNLYGPTEASIDASGWPCEQKEKQRYMPLGRPIDNAQIYILDQELHPVPVGVTGDIYIGGAGLGRGYIGNPDLTAERFLPAPHNGRNGGRIYKTGDRGRYRSGGVIEYLGREDFQVKIRGFRIELGEIESRLAECAGVRQAVAVVHEDSQGEKRLSAYVVFDEPGRKTAIDQLEQELKSKLPDYMLPAIVELDRMPLTLNGKIDRRALPEPGRGNGQVYVAPRTAIEESLAQIWSFVLKVERVGIRDNFFALGGHSLMAMQLMARVQEVFQIDIPLRRLFEHWTVEGLARAIGESLGGAALWSGPIPRRGKDERRMLSYAQQRLLFLDRLEPDSPFYNVAAALKIEGSLNAEFLERSLNEIVRRHESLRTRFGSEGGEPVPEVLEEMNVLLQVQAVEGESPDEKWEEVHRLSREEANRPFNLSAGPVFRAQLLRVGPQEHIALLTMHHIVSDEWSMGVLIDELGHLYRSHVEEKEPQLEELPIQYGDYAAWQREWLKGDALEKQLLYWRRQMEGASGVLELPTDRPRPAAQSFRGAHYAFRLDPATSSGLRELARGENVTLFMSLIAAFDVLLWRYTRQEDIQVGSPIANRTRIETEKLIGLFLNTLVLRTRVDVKAGFLTLLRSVREVALGAYAHQDISFEKLVEELKPRRDPSRSPLFQAMFALQNAPRTELKLPGLRLSVWPDYLLPVSKFDLMVVMEEADGVLGGTLEYNTDLFEEQTMVRMIAHWRELLGEIVADPERAVTELSFLSGVERAQIAYEWNRTKVEQEAKSVAELFEEQVMRSPEAVAVEDAGEKLSYAGLNQRANQVGWYLRRLGVGPDVLAGICMERSIAAVVGLLGILKAGGAYVPLDPEYPAERLAYMAGNSEIKVLLTRERFKQAFSKTGATLALWEQAWPQMAGGQAANLDGVVHPGNLVYVIYTSGSTGKPKGVMVTHGGLTNYLQWACEAYQTRRLEGAPVHSSISFDLTVTSLYGTLLGGGRVLLGGESKGVENLQEQLEKCREKSLVKLTPSHLEVLRENTRKKRWKEKVGVAVIGGEALRYEQLEDLRSQLGKGTRLINEYGPTETVVGCCVYEVRAGDAGSGAVPIGKPIANTEMYILDDAMELVPAGVAGEIYIGGAGLARGYWKESAFTAEKFVPHPWSIEGGERLYRSGDLGKYRANGVIEYVGRTDEQVKIRGYRIELGEIEAVLGSCAGVREAAAVVREDDGDKRLVGYVVLQGKGSVSEVKEELKRKIPEYMVPAVVVELERLPLTENGKVDRQGLPAPFWEGSKEFLAPRTPTEEVLSQLWIEVLKVERVGAHDNFFELGGHSLLAMQLMFRVHDTFGVDIPLRRLFDHWTLESLARLVEEVMAGGAVWSGAIPRRSRKERRTLSFAQQRLLFLNQMMPDNSFYNVSSAVKLEGVLDVQALERSLNEVVRRHEVLRTRFVMGKSGEPEQEVIDELWVELTVREVQGHRHEAKWAEAIAWIDQEAQKPFDLWTGPLVRARLLRVAEHEHLALLTMHHIVSDQWSMGILVEEMGQSYRAFSRGEEPQLEELPIQYGDYAAWQRERLQGEILEKQLIYWRQQMEGMSGVLELPADRVRPAVQTFNGAHHAARLSSELGEGLSRLGKSENVTLFMLIAAVFQVFLWRYTGQTDIAVGTPIANRLRRETQRLIGFFLNTLLLRMQFNRGETFRELLRRVREVILGAFAHQDIPFEKLVEELKPERDLSRAPLFQVLVSVENATQRELDLPGVRLVALEEQSPTAKFDLSLFVTREEAGALSGELEYNTDLFDASTIARMWQHWERLLIGLASNPDVSLTEIPLLCEIERMQILGDWNQTEVRYEQKNLVELFEEQVARVSGSVAVEYEGLELSYETLNARANQLGGYLRTLGVGPDVLVGICVERSLEMVLGLMGILKAGGAYVPFDPGYPADRLKYMFEDSGVAIMLTHQPASKILSEIPCRAVYLDRDWEVIARESDKNLVKTVDGEDLAYAIYTSGSTGRPKGAMNRHHGISNRIQWMQQAYQLGGHDLVLQKTPFSFDVSVWEFFWPLTMGARLVVARPGGHQDSSYLVDLIRRRGITTIHFVPSMLHAFVEEPGMGKCASLKRVICSGEALGWELQEKFLERLAGAELHNLYGPTEAAVDVTYWRCESGIASRRVPLGRPIANLQIYILDIELNPAPVGVSGEIYIGGAGLARGYLNRPALTAERFIPCPFNGKSGERMYKTGDLGRFLSDGVIEYLGRTDHQVKIRGNRIELGEIESVLSQHPGVEQAVVIARTEKNGEKRLVGYVVPRPGQEVNASILRAHLTAALPEYMAPAAWRFLEKMPLTPNGKVDRKGLPAPEIQKQEYVAPRNETEAVLARVWSKVLGISEVGVHENFFALGGDSIHSLQVIALAKNEGLDLSLPQLFRSPTVAGLAREAAVKVSDSVQSLTHPFSMLSEEDRQKIPGDVEDAYPLAVMQAGMMYLMDLTPDVPVYHNVDSITLRFRFDLGTFMQAVQASTDRHAHLRTSFDMLSYSEPLQLIHKKVTIPVGYTDIRHLSPQERQEAVLAFVRNEQHRTRHFDLNQPPLIRFHIHQRDDETLQLTITEAHPIQDGWSLHLVLTEIFTRYFQLLEDPSLSPLPPLKTSYRDYIYLERLALNSEQDRNYWKEQMRDCSLPQIPQLAGTQGPNSGPDIQDIRLVCSVELTERVKRLAGDAGVPVKSVYLASQLRVLSLITGQTDIVTGLTTNGRLEVEDGELVGGLFLNNAPFRARLNGGSWRQLIRQTFDSELEMLPHRRYPVAQVHRDHGWRRLFDTAFNYTHFHVTKGILESGNIEVLDAMGLDPSDLTLYVQFEPHFQTGQITIGLHYDSTKISRPQGQRIGGYFIKTLESMAADPDQDYRLASVLPESEIRQVLTEWNDTASEYPAPMSLMELWSEQLSRTPKKIALIDEKMQISYAELEQSANQLARYLRKSGVVPQTLVGICMERSVAMVVGLLGILKAGGVYVPLDPGYPRERLSYMMSDASVSVIVTSHGNLARIPLAAGVRAICLDEEQERIRQESVAPVPLSIGPEDLAYVIYTSGSTGRPKGVMATHRATVNRLEWMWRSYPFAPDEICCQKTTLSFVDSVAEILAPLLQGVPIVILPDDAVRDPEALVASLAKEKITRLLLVPSLLRAVLNRFPGLQSHVPRLKLLITSGEALSPELARECRKSLPQVRLLNLYGSSEVAADVTCFELTGNEVASVSIGRPIFNSRVYLLDENLYPAPIGTTGELYVAGSGLARGYLNRPHLTAEKFIPDPFGGRGGERLYRTGDIARWREDGNLEYIGRIDNQVKIRGVRIEIGEIESALREHPEVEEAAVALQQMGEDDSRLVAYVVRRESASELESGDLRAGLQGSLPDFMVPAIVFLKALPMLPNGKLDRNALPSDTIPAAGQKEPVAPRDEVEEILALLWQESLHLDNIGVHDNFFALGGHSLLISQVMLRVRAIFRIEVPLRSFFGLENPTIAGFAELLKSKEPQPGYVLQIGKAMVHINSLAEADLEDLAEGKATTK